MAKTRVGRGCMWPRLRVEGCFTNSLTQSNSIKLHCIHSLVSSFQLYNERPGKSPASFPGHSHILSHSCEEKPTVIKCPGNEAYVVLFPDPVQYLVLKSLRDVTNLLVALLFHSCVSSAVLEEGSPPLPRLLMIHHW